MEEMNTLQLLSGHSDRVWDAAWNYTGKILATCSGDKSIRFWSETESKWECHCVISDHHQRTVRSIAWSPCGQYLAAGSFDATISVWKKRLHKLETEGKLEFSLLTTLEGHSNEVKCISWSASGQYLASCGRDKTVWIWEFDEDEDFQCVTVLQPHTQDVKCVTWHPVNEVLVSSSYDNTINIYKESLDDWAVVCKLEEHGGTVWKVSFDKEGKRLASCSDDLSVKIWTNTKVDMSEWICLFTLSGYHTRSIYDCSWCCSANLLVTASGDNSLCVYRVPDTLEADRVSSSVNDLSVALLMRKESAHDEDINACKWNASRPGLLASVSDDSFVKIWRLTNFDDILNR